MTRTMIVNMKSMGHVCSNIFFSIFLRRDIIVFRKMSLLHWLTKLTHQTLYREKAIGELLWRQWCHGDWMLKTVSEIVFCFILTTRFKWIVIRTWFMDTIFGTNYYCFYFHLYHCCCCFHCSFVFIVAIFVNVLVFFLSSLVLVWLLLLLL